MRQQQSHQRSQRIPPEGLEYYAEAVTSANEDMLLAQFATLPLEEVWTGAAAPSG